MMNSTSNIDEQLLVAITEHITLELDNIKHISYHLEDQCMAEFVVGKILHRIYIEECKDIFVHRVIFRTNREELCKISVADPDMMGKILDSLDGNVTNFEIFKYFIKTTIFAIRFIMK